MSNINNTKAKPTLRGISHQYGCVLSLGLALWLILEAQTETVRGIAAIYGGSLVALLGVSALYHRIDWPPVKRQWMRRLDHTMIFVLIAGSYTPVCTLVLEGELAQNTLMIVWGAVVFGAIYKLLWINGPKWVMAALCVGVGWVAVVTLGELYERLGTVFIVWLSAGGFFYTVGALVYAFKRPDPIPETFGYHEIFHALVLAAAACHYVAFKVYIFDPLAVA